MSRELLLTREYEADFTYDRGVYNCIKNSLNIDESERYTTGEASRYLNISPQTVKKWCNKDKIRNNAVVKGSLHKRITGRDLIMFIMKNDFMDACMSEKLFTPGNIAKILECKPWNIINLIDDKKIYGGRFPNSTHRYVTSESFNKYLDSAQIKDK